MHVASLFRIALLLLLACTMALGQAMPGTAPLVEQGDPAQRMVEGIDRFLDRLTWEAAGKRPAPDGARFRKIIGLLDRRVPAAAPAFEAAVGRPALVAEGAGYRVHAVRWAVMPGVEAEGLMLEPARPPLARVVAIPDADWTPEMLVGLAAGVPPEAQFARRLAENGCLVLVPVLIDRRDTFSANPRAARSTNQPHREFIYRMAYEMGRHIIGYEVQKILAAIDWFAAARPVLPSGVIGYGEGGLLALYAAAADERIQAAAVSGYFGPREAVWQEPIYRNVWSLLRDFGDAGVAGLIAPRALIIEAAGAPEVAGPAPDSKERRGAAPGRLTTPALADVQAEVARARRHFEQAGAADRPLLVVSRDGHGQPGSEPALRAFVRALGVRTAWKPPQPAPRNLRTAFDPAVRLRRQFDQLVEFTQDVVRRSEAARRASWPWSDVSLERWPAQTESYRRYFWEEVMGRLPEPSEPAAAQTRRVYDEPRWTGYEVMLPVWPGVPAYGVLLVPKDIRPGERRPVVVCQHGLEGRPADVIEARRAATYAQFAARLAEQGFVTYAPQNPYIFGNRFRQLQRKANPLKLSLLSFIIGQHQRALEWLASLPFVDPDRIGFYGLSYGGKTAMRVPAVLPRYALSICSGDFNEWIWKNTSYDRPFSYMYTGEYEMFEFDLGNTFNYAEMAALIAPRPFMVERGHRDGVGIDEWVAYEYARVRRLYVSLGIGERTAIEFFDGPHQIHGVGTFEFLKRHLRWPQ
jgi:dienelactone hydrolase